MARPTIADVAKLAGVSKATVSRVLSGNFEYMRDNTRSRVERAIEELNYRPSSVARSLTSKRTFTAAVMISDVSNAFYGDVIHGAEDVALDAGYNIYLCNTNYDMDRGINLVQSFIDKRVDGVLIMSSTMSNDWLDLLVRNRVPTVVLDWSVRPTDYQVSVVGVRYDIGIKQAVSHLVELGHTRFAHISGPLELPTSHSRRNQFTNALVAHGISVDDVVHFEGDLRPSGGRAAVREYMSLDRLPTAVFAANDLTAIGFMAGAREQGISIPGDISVVGLDNVWFASQTDPPLTTVGLPRYEIGQVSMQLLLDLLDGREAAHVEVETSLHVRSSTARRSSNRS